jgi:Ni2+-binding GTPase involved in maturation of urease and hydrogenase
MTGVPPAFAEDRSEARLPVTVITGFLGSGKTTLVKHILTNQHGLRTAVIVNEFSELGIDSELIVSADDDMVELENGCICCSINNNFMDSIFRILARDRKVDYLVVETTGLADPLPVVLTFLRTEFRDLTRVDSIITVADAGSFCLDLFESEAARNQLRYGDVILLNKCDLVDAQRLHALEESIRGVKEDARIIRTTQCAALHSSSASACSSRIGSSPLRSIRTPVTANTIMRRRIGRRTTTWLPTVLSRCPSRATGRSRSTSFRIFSIGFLRVSIVAKACCGSTRATSGTSFIWWRSVSPWTRADGMDRGRTSWC